MNKLIENRMDHVKECPKDLRKKKEDGEGEREEEEEKKLKKKIKISFIDIPTETAVLSNI